MPPHPTSWRSILIISFHLHPGLPRGLFPSCFPTKTLHTPFPSIYCYMPRPSHLQFDHPIIFGEEQRSTGSSLCSFLHSPVTSSLLGPNILFRTLFSNTLSLRSSLNVNNKVSHPYNTIDKTIDLCILIFIYIVNLKTKHSAPNDKNNSLALICF